ncbi:MAG: nuclear transport factor 2 family protein [Actinobacteria bacterium]|nr:MAG: nuclear transport factor 2 family protein [Actinomycetota bacterium]
MSINIQLNDEAAALYSKGDIDGFVDTYADDAVLRSPDGVSEGKQAIREYWTQEKAAFPDGNVEMTRSARRHRAAGHRQARRGRRSRDGAHP